MCENVYYEAAKIWRYWLTTIVSHGYKISFTKLKLSTMWEHGPSFFRRLGFYFDLLWKWRIHFSTTAHLLCQLFLFSPSVSSLSQPVVIIQQHLLNVFKMGYLSSRKDTFDTSCQTAHFSVSKTITAGLQVSAGVDILPSLACPTFSIYPTWPLRR